ncbi:unnamed protein product [Schistosoma margrebowiei]|uniref:Uncharacterized protein n=1 Tax=Schistosoma margrebowiei TaxID=48269 RepID=A0A3P8C0B4_9TREM|nr:unnamed protein product [Schistosoma margrebowiei]
MFQPIVLMLYHDYDELINYLVYRQLFQQVRFDINYALSITKGTIFSIAT